MHQVELEDLLPAATVMVVTVTATTTAGKALGEDALAKTLAGCAMALTLDDDKQQARRHQLAHDDAHCKASSVHDGILLVVHTAATLVRTGSLPLSSVTTRCGISSGLSVFQIFSRLFSNFQ
jgi:hypothetical protein